MMHGDNYQYHIREIQEKKGINKTQTLVIVGIIVLIGLIVFLMTRPPNAHQSVDAFLKAWSEWDMAAMEAMMTDDFYAGDSTRSLTYSMDWLQRNRPTEWEIGETSVSMMELSNGVKMGGGFVEAEIRTMLSTREELLILVAGGSSGWSVEAVRRAND
jgi:hypothetical protein